MNDYIDFAHKKHYWSIRRMFMFVYYVCITIISIGILFFFKNVSKSSLFDIITTFIPVIIAITIGYINLINWIFNKCEFIFDNRSMSYIHKPPIIADFLLQMKSASNEIHDVKEINKMPQNFQNNSFYVQVNYKFNASQHSSGYISYGRKSNIGYSQRVTKHQYNPKDFNITINHNGDIIYDQNLTYFEKIYFKNPNNTIIDNLGKFITAAMNDAIYAIIDNKTAINNN